MTKIGNFKVYFDKKGNLLRRHRYWDASNEVEEDNKIFSDRLEYVSCGGSQINFKSLNSNRQYGMFLSDFNKVMQAKKLQNNIIEGEFFFTRKGLVQGLRMLLPEQP